MIQSITDPLAIKHSEKLTNHIRHEIDNAGGLISFARFMELALYAPGLGYYSAGSHKLGKHGDFITAPEISPLFAKCLARQCQQILSALSTGDILEIGAGSGIFAKDLLLELEKINCLPEHYFILEISAELRLRQKQLLTLHCPHLLARIHWLDSLPSTIDGIIFANEVLDAFPVHCFNIYNNKISERSVTWEHQQFAWLLSEPSISFEQAIKAFSLPPYYQSEISFFIQPWIKSLSAVLKTGIILLLDYGYGRDEYYHPDRNEGTLMCFHQHRKHSDPFIHIGLQDITAHVDFTLVIESAFEAGLSLAGYTTQAAFLLGCGLLTFADQNSLSNLEHYKQNQAIKTLTLPSQMGEIIKVIALSKELNLDLLGFALQDRRHNL